MRGHCPNYGTVTESGMRTTRAALDNPPEEIWDEAYVEWIERADAEGEVPGAKVYRRYLDALEIDPGHAVLDLGVGTGRLLPEILKRGRWVCGLDLSMTMMVRARERLDGRGALVNGDAQTLPFADGSFDRVVAWAIWENIPDQRQALAEIARVLRPGGRVLFGTKNLSHHRNLRLVWYRIKQRLARRVWRRVCRQALLVRLIPGALKRKFERLMARREVPQYPTLWSGLLRAARRSELRLSLVHKFSGASYEDDVRLPESCCYHQKLIVMFEKAAD